ncbi:hypothetical protein [Methanosphaerula subterraneus]|uniref:hypothetical protein n=1 Tax=Methanosphaerula subterraneus TaxID=3350244 RepID=UPI003F85DE18
MTFEFRRWMITGTGILLLGAAWLGFWLGPALPLYLAEPRWAHNFAFALIFITVGIASLRPSVLTGTGAVIASFITIPTELAFWSGMTATAIEGVLLVLVVGAATIEWWKKGPLIVPGPRAGFWLKTHLPLLSALGIAHMPFIFFLSRWVNGVPYLQYLPIEHEYSTTIFNAMLLVLVGIAIIEQYAKNVGRFSIQRAGFFWSVLMLLIPLASIGILGS